MKKLFLLLTIIFIGVSAFSQTVDSFKKYSPAKLNLINFTNNTYGGALTELKQLTQLLSESDTNVILLEGYSWASMFFLNSWFHAEEEKDSIFETYLKRIPALNIYQADAEKKLKLDLYLDDLRTWKSALTINQKKLIKFESFFTVDQFQNEMNSNIFLIHYFTEKIKGLDIDIQTNIDANEAVYDYLTLIDQDLSLSETYNPSFKVSHTLFEFFHSIDKIDTAIRPFIDHGERGNWIQYVQSINALRFSFANKYLYVDDGEDPFKNRNQLLLELDKINDTSNKNYFLLLDDGHFYKELDSKAPVVSLRTILADLYPNVAVKRVLFYENRDSILTNAELHGILFHDIFTDTVGIVKIAYVDSTEAVYDSAAAVEYTADSESENSFISKPFAFRSFGFESVYSRWHNDIKSFKEVADPSNQMNHISTIGCSFVIQDGPTLSGLRSYRSHNTRYRINYNQLFSNESIDNLWANQIGISIENKLFETNFLSIYLGNNLSYYNFTLSKTLSSPFDQFITNPSEMYQVTNDGFLYGMGLNMKVALSAIYLRAEAGYQYDMSDSRWQYHGNKINSVGKMNATGGYFELGLGLNYGY